MNRFFSIMALAVVLIAASVPAFAQTATTQTILSAAVANGTVGTITVASTTGFTASSGSATYNVWVDGEFMKVNSVNTSTGVIGVTRGVQSRATAHPTAAVVFFGPAGQAPFVSQNPAPGTNCTSTQWTYLPLINVADGTISNCLAAVSGSITGSAGSRWISHNFRQWAYGHPTVFINDAAYTATLADEFIIYSRLHAARTVTLPAITGVLGKTIFVKNNTESVLTITVAASANQGVGTAGSNTIVVNASAAGGGNVGRFISVATSAGGWSWATF